MGYKKGKKTLTIYLEGAIMTDIAAFYQQINEQLMGDEEWQLGESLDAFDDVLYGGYSRWKDYDQLEIVWKDMAIAEQRLGMETTRAYYASKLGQGSPYNQDRIKQKLEELTQGTGQTYFEILVEIIESHHDTVKLVRN